MKKLMIYIPLMTLLGGCLGFGGGNKALPDKRTQVPGSTQVNNYLDQVTTANSVHCVDDGEEQNIKAKTYFHDGFAKISTNHVGREVSHAWDDSWNEMIGETLETKFPELISDETKLHEGELAQLGCAGFSVASKDDKKRFWALFLASLARVQSGFDPSFKEGESTGLFALDPSKVGPLGGECEGKDKYDFMEPSYSFGCVFQALKAQQENSGSLFADKESVGTIFKSLTGTARFEFIKFFKAHAAPQFSFCSNGVNAPSELTQRNVEGEKSSDKCSIEQQKKIRENLDRKASAGKDTGSDTASADEKEKALLKSQGHDINNGDKKTRSTTNSK